MKNISQKRFEDQLYIVGLCIPVVVAIAFYFYRCFSKILEHFYMPCIFHKMTGFYCPGCGGTRAVLSLLKGEVLLSFCYHPLVLYTVVIYLWFMLSHTIEKITHGACKVGLTYRNAYLWMALVILIINIAVKDIALTAFDIDLLQLLDMWK